MPLAVITFTEQTLDREGMERFAGNVVIGIREYLARNVRHRTGRTEESIKAAVYGKQIVVDSSMSHTKALDRGSYSSRVMWHLINKVVPLKLGDGRTVFRRVTLESIRNGKWRTKPRAGLNFVEKGIEIARGKSSLRSRLNFTVVKP